MAHTTKSIAHVCTRVFNSYARAICGQVRSSTFRWHSGIASLAATSIAPPRRPNNDNVVGLSPNEIFVTQKNYMGIGPVDHHVRRRSTAAARRNTRSKKACRTTPGCLGCGYHIELGYGFDAGFVKSTPGDGLDFDCPDYDSGFQFAPVAGFLLSRR